MSKPVITRFAPSPTGFLHIGGARTALFNWLFAKANGGKMLLRIEDTDRERSTQAATDAILDGLKWLGLEWEGDPISQYSRIDRHREITEELINRGGAYRCYCTPEELENMRERARAEGKNPVYDGTWRDRDPADAPENMPYVVRIKSPANGETVLKDRVQGDVTFPNEALDDFVLLRSDGNPTYMLAVVVDDHDMGVTHIIRGDDHLTNAAKQIIIYNTMGWPVPQMAHIPLIHGPDGKKLSKRHGAIGAETYRAMGYLPQAIRNYLVRLGWSHGDDEIISLEQMIDWFNLENINKGAARFDYDKLDALNAHYLRDTADIELLALLMETLPEFEGGSQLLSRIDDQKMKFLSNGMASLKGRSKTLLDIVENAQFIFVDRPIPMDGKAVDLVVEGKKHLGILHGKLSSLDDWSHDGISNLMRKYCEQNDVKLGKVAQPIRAALTGMANSPGAFDVLLTLGKTESLIRLSDQL